MDHIGSSLGLILWLCRVKSKSSAGQNKNELLFLLPIPFFERNMNSNFLKVYQESWRWLQKLAQVLMLRKYYANRSWSYSLVQTTSGLSKVLTMDEWKLIYGLSILYHIEFQKLTLVSKVITSSQFSWSWDLRLSSNFPRAFKHKIKRKLKNNNN